MNFLAHIYLSGENDLLKVGNFMADSVKGNDYLDYKGDLQKGILLHRTIDSFTDANETYRKSKHRLHEDFGHYSGVIMDVVYDYFLAKNWYHFSEIHLADYIQDFYQLLLKNLDVLPEKTKRMSIYMIDQNWLLSYATLEGLEKILLQMSFKIGRQVDLSKAVQLIAQNETLFESEFFEFMEEIKFICQEKLKELG